MIHQVVFEHLGENATTDHDPICALADFAGDLNAVVTRCMSSDNDMAAQVTRYQVRDVLLPDWLPVQEWLCNNISWAYMWNRGVDPSWPEAWQRKLITLSAISQLVSVKLLKTKKFRSNFRQSCNDQLQAWLGGTSNFPRPFTDRQLDYLVTPGDCIAAKRLDENCYSRKLSNKGVLTSG